MILQTLALILGAALLFTGCGGSSSSNNPEPAPLVLPEGTSSQSLISGGRTRTFRVRIPPGHNPLSPVGVVYVLHGRFGTGANAETTYGFNGFADGQGWVVVYPDGVDQSWADGRGTTPADTAGVNDVVFFDDLHQFLGECFAIDPLRVYACGMSNGALMSQRLGHERAARFAGIATVAGTLATSLTGTVPTQAISVLMIHGEADSLAPYSGGSTSNGSVFGVEALADRWRGFDGLALGPSDVALPDSATDDGCQAWSATQDGGTDQTAVRRIRITGGGHTWPGRTGVLDIGNLCRDFDATRVIWQFFVTHPRPAPAG